MPADWTTFITNVSNKLDGQTIQASYDPEGRNTDDFASFLSQQYVIALVGKAQSPYGNLHQKGDENVLIRAFSQAFKMLESEKSPTLEEKETDPLYESLEAAPEPQDLDSVRDQFDLDFLAWINENSTTISDFTYSQFFSQFPNFPSTEDQVVTEVARRIISRFDGTSSYLQWIYSLKLQRPDELSDLTSKVYDKIVELTQGLNQKEIKVGDEVQGLASFNLDRRGNEDRTRRISNGDLLRGKVISIIPIRSVFGTQLNDYVISVTTSRGDVQRTVSGSTVQKKISVSEFRNVRDINLNRKVLQSPHSSDPDRIPSYVTQKFISRFTYDPKFDDNIFTRILLTGGAYIETTNQMGHKSIQRLTQAEIQEQINRADLATSLLYSGSIQRFLDGDVGNLNVSSSFLLKADYLSSRPAYSQTQAIYQLFDNISARKISEYNREYQEFSNLTRRYIDFLKVQNQKSEDQINENDPYSIMAQGVIGYWISCLQQPLSSSPPVPPCTIIPPLNGFYTPVYYGSSKNLENNLRRAFNDGKKFKDVKTGKIIASSLAYSFQRHLLELKFIYNGGIPTTGGPAPMVGFISLVF